MKQTLFTLLSTLIFTSTFAQEPEFEWAKQLGGTMAEIGRSISLDNSGNVYTTGAFQGTADFDPDPLSSFNLTSVGSSDIFISKFDGNGSFIWAKAMGGSNSESGADITIDDSGNVYTIGAFQGTVDFDPGIGIYNLTSAGYENVFISKLDANGNFIWVKQIVCTGRGTGYSIAIDDSNNVYTTGYFEGTADFDPDTGNFFLSSAGEADIFISKLDANGNFVWAKSNGGIEDDYGSSIAIDGNDNIYTTDFFTGIVDFDPDSSSSFYLSSAGSLDIFISKLDANGNFIWAKSMGGTNTDRALSIAIDINGNVYTSGYFNDTADFNPDTSGIFNLSSAGRKDIFISKLDAAGNFLWAKAMGGPGEDYANNIAVDSKHNVYVTGFFTGIVDFDPNSSTSFNLTAGGKDVFISKLDATGNFIWAKAMGGPGNDECRSIGIYGNDFVYATGYFQYTADFDPDPSASFNLTSLGGYDIFILKLSPCASKIRGQVFLDLNENCIKDTGEINISHTPLLTIQPGNHIVQTAANGRWQIDSLPAGNYTATIDTSNANWLLTCPPSQSFTVDHIDSCTQGPDFGFVAKYPCPAPDIINLTAFDRYFHAA